MIPTMQRCLRLILYAAGGLLLASGLTRLVCAGGTAQVLRLPDPILEIPLRHSLLVVGLLEITISLVCLFGRRMGLRAGWLAWLGTSFLIYRLGLNWMDYRPELTCLGYPGNPLRLAHGALSFAGIALQGLLLLGSYGVFLCLRLNPAPPADLR